MVTLVIKAIAQTKVLKFNYSQYIAGNLIPAAAGCIVTLFIFDDMTENVQIAVSSLQQTTVRKPPSFIIKADRIRVIY